MIGKGTENVARVAPAIKAVSSEDHISVTSPVKPLSYDEANAKIYEGADSLSFNVSKDCLGRVDVVSLGTKDPSEDRWDVGIVRRPDGRDTLYAGIYDGHKYVYIVKNWMQIYHQRLIPSAVVWKPPRCLAKASSHTLPMRWADYLQRIVLPTQKKPFKRPL